MFRHRRTLLAAALLSAAVVAFASRARTEEDAPDEMEGWMALGTPGPEHAWLAGFVGDWNVETRFYEGDGEPTVGHGKASIASLWGGRYLDMRYTGDFMGNPFEGRGTWAYNNGAKRYESTWIDGFSTQLATTTGHREGETLTLSGRVYTPSGEVATRDVVKREGPDRWILSSWWAMPQGERNISDLVFTRAKPASEPAPK